MGDELESQVHATTPFGGGRNKLPGSVERATKTRQPLATILLVCCSCLCQSRDWLTCLPATHSQNLSPSLEACSFLPFKNSNHSVSIHQHLGQGNLHHRSRSGLELSPFPASLSHRRKSTSEISHGLSTLCSFSTRKFRTRIRVSLERLSGSYGDPWQHR